MNIPLSYSISLSEDRMDLARRLAEASHRRWSTKTGNYDNTSHNHLLGRVGEVGVSDMLSATGAIVIPHYMHECDEGLCDITTNGIDLEIKTWTSGLWGQYGRAVAVNQYDRVAGKASLIVWCTWDESSREVRIMGCSPPSDMLLDPARWTGPNPERRIHNYQILPWRVMPPHVLAETIGVRSGSEVLVSRAYRAVVRADTMEIICCDPVSAKVRWTGKTTSCDIYLPVDGANMRTGRFLLTGMAWDDFADGIREDSLLTLSFSDDGSRITLRNQNASFEISTQPCP